MLRATHSRTGALTSSGLRAAALIVLCVAALAACGKKEASKPQGMGPLVPFLDIGTRGMWTGELKDNVYSLSNTQEPRALRTITLLRTEDPKYSVGVDLLFEGQIDGIAGLVFAHNSAEKHYYLIALQPNGNLVLYNRTASSLTREREKQVTLKPGFNRMAFEGEGNTVVIKINGKEVDTYVAQGLSEGGAGIAALGTGTFKFTNFTATGYKREPPAAPAAQSGGAESKGSN